MRVSENWRMKNERYALKCEQASSEMVFPPRPVAPRRVDSYTFNHDVENYAWTVQEPAYIEVK